MKLVISIVLTVIAVLAVEQENPKKTPFETDRSSEAMLQQKVNFENKAKDRKVQSNATEVKSDSTPVPSESKAPSEATNSESQLLECKSGNQIRSIEIRKKGSGCEVIYTKKGEPKVIAQQKLGNLRCDHVFQDLQSKLSKGGFVCESK